MSDITMSASGTKRTVRLGLVLRRKRASFGLS